MEDTLITLLESFGLPVFRQGSMTKEEPYPDSFFTFWNNNSPDHAHYDNEQYGTEWDFDVNFYSNDPNVLYSIMSQARILLKQNGWIVPSSGYDVISDEPTHNGRGIQALYLQVERGN